jgi:hypothetical protein
MEYAAIALAVSSHGNQRHATSPQPITSVSLDIRSSYWCTALTTSRKQGGAGRGCGLPVLQERSIAEAGPARRLDADTTASIRLSEYDGSLFFGYVTVK